MDAHISYLGDCITNYNQNSEFSCGGTYNSIKWYSTNITKPTYDEIKAEETKIIQGLPFKKLREQRNELLEATDAYGLTDFPFTNDTKKQEWMTYRQNLRNLPSNSEPKLDTNGKLYNITWPTKPSSH